LPGIIRRLTTASLTRIKFNFLTEFFQNLSRRQTYLWGKLIDKTRNE